EGAQFGSQYFTPGLRILNRRLFTGAVGSPEGRYDNSPGTNVRKPLSPEGTADFSGKGIARRVARDASRHFPDVRHARIQPSLRDLSDREIAVPNLERLGYSRIIPPG